MNIEIYQSEYAKLRRIEKMHIQSDRLLMRKYDFTESEMEKFQDRLLGIERRYDALNKRKDQGCFRIWKHYLDLDMRIS